MAVQSTVQPARYAYHKTFERRMAPYQHSILQAKHQDEIVQLRAKHNLTLANAGLTARELIVCRRI